MKIVYDKAKTMARHKALQKIINRHKRRRAICFSLNIATLLIIAPGPLSALFGNGSYSATECIVDICCIGLVLLSTYLWRHSVPVNWMSMLTLDMWFDFAISDSHPPIEFKIDKTDEGFVASVIGTTGKGEKALLCRQKLTCVESPDVDEETVDLEQGKVLAPRQS